MPQQKLCIINLFKDASQCQYMSHYSSMKKMVSHQL